MKLYPVGDLADNSLAANTAKANRQVAADGSGEQSKIKNPKQNTPMKTKITSLITAGILGTSLASQAATIVYQSDFTGYTVGDAGLTSTGASGAIWNIDTVNDDLNANFPGGGDRATVRNIGGWQDGSITLDVTFNQTTSSNDFTIGLFDVSTGNWNYGNDFMQDGTANKPYAIAFSTDGPLENANGNDDVLSFYNGSTTSTLSDAQGNITFGQYTTLSLTITADSWSYSLNGAAATTGSGSFDMSKSYAFAAYGHQTGSALNGSYISNITISVPEPSSTALLGLGGLALMLRRKRS